MQPKTSCNPFAALFHRLALLTMVVPAVTLIAAAWLIRSKVRIRFFCIPSRFGHLVLEAGLSVLENQGALSLKNEQRQILFCYQERPLLTNQAVLRELQNPAGWRLIPRSLGIVAMRIIRSTNSLTMLERKMQGGAVVDCFYATNWRQLATFRKRDCEVTANLVTAGFNDSRPIVAILTRDSISLKQRGANHQHIQNYSYRNCCIKNYYETIECLTAQGFQVARVGRAFGDHLQTRPQYYLDYSSSGQTSDSLDLEIARNTQLIITCSSGLDALYWLFGVPHLGVNVPFLHGGFAHFTSALPKRMFVLDRNREVELPQLAVTKKQFSLHPVPMWEDTPIAFRENTPSEILEAVQLGLQMMHDDTIRRRRIEMAKPLWGKFNESLSRSHLPAELRQRFPTMGLPDSVMSRFLSV